MFIMQLLLTAILVVLVIGFALVIGALERIFRDQSRGAAEILRYFGRLLGEPNEGEARHLMRAFGTFLAEVEAGRIPNLRSDTWHPTKADLKRWKEAQVEHEYLDH